MYSLPVLRACEPDAQRLEEWKLDAYFEGKPNAAAIRQVSELVNSAQNAQAELEKLPDEVWVTLSKQGLQPVTAGRFLVHNMADDPVPAPAKACMIEAGQVLAISQHETTEG